MRGLFVILMGLMLLGGGAAGYFTLLKPAQAGETKKAEKEQKVEDLHFVEMSPLILPIIGSNGISQTISVVVTLEVNGEKHSETVKMKKPRLSDAFLQDMYGSLSRQAALSGGVVKVSTIKKRLNRVSQKVLGPDMVNDVLIQVVQQRKV